MARRGLSPPGGLGLRLRTARLTLRPPRAADAPVIARALTENAAHLAQTTPSRSVALADVARRVDDERRAFASGEAFALYAFLGGREAELLVGKVALFRIEREAGRASLGYWIDRAHQGRGLGLEATAAAVALGLDEARLLRLVAAIQPGNRRSLALADRLGFRAEGRAVTLAVGDAPRAHELYALSSDEWASRRGSLPQARRE